MQNSNSDLHTRLRADYSTEDFSTARSRETAEVKAQETTSAPPYGSPNPPPPGQPYNQQTAPTQPLPQQLLTVQPQPPPLTGVHYYTQAYPAVSGAGKYSEGRTCHSHSHYPSPHTTQPQVVLAQPQMPIVATQQILTRPTDTKLPKYAFVTSVVATIILSVLWSPGRS